jgi:hypothetical protein
MQARQPLLLPVLTSLGIQPRLTLPPFQVQQFQWDVPAPVKASDIIATFEQKNAPVSLTSMEVRATPTTNVLPPAVDGLGYVDVFQNATFARSTDTSLTKKTSTTKSSVKKSSTKKSTKTTYVKVSSSLRRTSTSKAQPCFLKRYPVFVLCST